MKRKNIIWIVVVLIAIVGLMMWGKTASRDAAGFWEDTEVLCLPLGHTNLAYHIHPTLEIMVDGDAEEVPANIGVSADCMAETHTHDATGKIHIETTSAGRNLTLGNFFEVWGESLERDGFEMEVTINGEPAAEPLEYIPQDLDAIEIRYTSTEKGDGPNDSATTSESTDGQRITTRIDQGASALDVKVVPLEVLEDSRCPITAKCIQAGTVRVLALLASGMGEANHVFELGKPITTETEIVTLIDVDPESTGQKIPPSEYHFAFYITRR